MKKKKIIIIGFSIIIIIVTLIIFSKVLLPGILVNLSMKKMQNNAGLEIKKTIIDNHEIYYFTGGKGETLLLLHGFGGNKENWLWISKHLTDKYHIIVPDIPGFGKSSKIKNYDYKYIDQVKRINGLMEKLSINKFHIAGNSMGGHISAIYALEYPDKILSIGLFDSAGVLSTEKSDYKKALESGINVFNIKSVEDYDRLMDFIFTKKPKVPNFIKEYFVNESIKNNDFNQYIFNQINKYPYRLEPHLNKINSPVLILWGEDDRLIHISSVKIFESNLNNYKTVIIKNCGHAPMVETPKVTAKYYTDFLEGLKL